MQTHVPDVQRAALGGLIDYAGLFPPAELEMRPAAAQYAAARSGPCAWMLGNFIVPYSRLSELRAVLAPGAGLPLSVILDAGAEPAQLEGAAHTAPELRVEALEVRLEPAQIPAFAERRAETPFAHLPAYVELQRDAEWTERLGAALPLLRAHGLCAKLRCGGLDAAAFPSPGEIAAFLEAAAREGVRFKATAGLHHPVRGLNPASGFTMHGFLNLIAAAALAYAGADASRLEAVLALEDAALLRFVEGGLQAGSRVISLEEIRAARGGFFAGYGSCSFEEPVEDLRALGLPL